jgi:hypothetical protein
MNDRPQELDHAQRDWKEYVELRLWFVGDIRRQFLAIRFGIQSVAANCDLRFTRILTLSNIQCDGQLKAYAIDGEHYPLFDLPAERIPTCLAEVFGDGESVRSCTEIASNIPSRLAQRADANSRYGGVEGYKYRATRAPGSGHPMHPHRRTRTNPSSRQAAPLNHDAGLRNA